MLAITGRRAFWRPSIFGWGNGIPHLGDEGADETHGAWRRVGERVAKRPRRVWITTALLLLVCAAGVLNLEEGLTQSNGFREKVEAVEGQELLAKSFPSGGSAPAEVIVPDASRVAAVRRAVADTRGRRRGAPGRPRRAGRACSTRRSPRTPTATRRST